MLGLCGRPTLIFRISAGNKEKEEDTLWYLPLFGDPLEGAMGAPPAAGGAT